jgi:phosphoribosylglycinamide formyltransferase-1
VKPTTTAAPNPTPIAIFASGRGSNFDAILRAVREGRLAADIVALVSDRAEAPALEKARAAGIRAIHVAPPANLKGDERRRAHEEAILRVLGPLSPRFLVMAGYMRVMTSTLIEAFRSERGYSRIVNVHPSLLPAFPGVSSYEQAFNHGAHLAGVSVHLVELEVDSGPICAQEAFSIADCASVEEVERRGLAIEHRLFPQTLSWVLPEKFEFIEITSTKTAPEVGPGGPKHFRGGNVRGTRFRVRPRSALREETI